VGSGWVAGRNLCVPSAQFLLFRTYIGTCLSTPVEQLAGLPLCHPSPTITHGGPPPRPHPLATLLKQYTNNVTVSSPFWATVCKKVHPMLSDHYLSCLSVCNVGVCGQTFGWIKMKLGIEVGLGQGDIVLDGHPAPPPKGHSPSPNFRSMSVVAKRLDGSRCFLLGR